MESAQAKEKIILGDFNLDELKHNATDYRCKLLYNELNYVSNPLNLIHSINFSTWQRVINNETKTSILDHIYVKNPLIINEINTVKP